MSRQFELLAIALSAATIVGHSSAFASVPILSEDPEALDPPERWDCERVLPEYQSYLDEGNSPDDWKHVGKKYLNIKDNKQYDWADWLRWLEKEDCAIGALVEDQVLALPLTAAEVVGALIPFFGPGLAAAANGERNISPG